MPTQNVNKAEEALHGLGSDVDGECVAYDVSGFEEQDEAIRSATLVRIEGNERWSTIDYLST